MKTTDIRHRWLMAIAIMFSVLTIFAQNASANIANGISGTCKWTIGNDGVLTVEPIDGESGELEDWGNEWNVSRAPWNDYAQQITSAVFKSEVRAKTCYYMFNDCVNMTSIDLGGLNTDDVQDMQYMFVNCSGLTSIDLSGLNTENVTTMRSMFWLCSLLTSLDMSSLNTSNVTVFGGMFYGCSNLARLNLTNFDMSKATYSKDMFTKCLRLSCIETENAVPTYLTPSIFESLSWANHCALLVPYGSEEAYAQAEGWNSLSLDLLQYSARGVSGDCLWFINDEGALQVAPISGWEGTLEDWGNGLAPWHQYADKVRTANFLTGVTAPTCHNMFQGCVNMESVNMDLLYTANASDFSYMFANCSALSSLDLSGFYTQNATDFSFMFASCSNLTSLDLSGFNTQNATDMSGMFKLCEKLNTITSNQDEPSPLKEGTFSTLPTKETCELIVPKGSEAAYRKASGWKAIMKKEIIGSASANDISLTNNETAKLDISLSNSVTDIVGLQFNLTLPEGVEPVMEGGKVTITPSDRLKGSYTLRGGKVANGSYLFTFLSSDRTAIGGTKGTLFSISLKNTSAEDGTYEASISDAVATDLGGEEYAATGSSFSVKIVHKYNLTYNVDDEEYQSFVYAVGEEITPITEPTKEGNTFSGWSEIPATMPANDVTITGSFTVNQYKLSYVVDGVVTDSMMVAFGATITPKEEPSQEGATFSGWLGVPETMPAHDVTVTGSFGTNFYHITYMVDDALYQEDNIAYGAAITPATEPTKEGYTFSGWSEIPATMPANDVTVTGSFTVNKYKLTYVVDGVATDSIMVDYGASITPKEEPSQEGATFSGWLGVPETMPAHDVTVTGSFGTNFYHITYMVDDALYQEGNIAYGAAITPATEPTKEGYTFSGWSEIPATMPANDVTITGSFTVNQYKLSYVVDGVVTDSMMVDYGASITPKEEPSQEGATFSGWLGVPETMPAHDVTVTGSFGTNFYHITYMVDETVYQEGNIAYGAAITPATEPTKEGYTFSGWSEIPATMPANDVTITGSFTVNKYKLTYVVDGVATDSIMVDYGASITPKEEPSQEGATFSGWLGVPETMPAHDVTVTGSFGTNFYHITYMVDETVYQEGNIAYGAAITPATEPTKEGYTFSGWSEIPETMPANDVTITGSFTVNKYKLTYVVDGVTTDSMMVAFGATITPKDNPTKEGATFSGWDGEVEVMPSHDVTVTGSFSTNSYHITYMVEEDVYQEADLAYGETITPATEPTKEGYTFSGWSEIPSTMPANDLTITGSFTINQYKLTYVVDGVTTDSMMVAFGATITPKEVPTKVGATFSGWDGEVEVMPSHDVTVTGSFSTNSYQITYMVDGVPYQQVELAYGAEITPITEPTKNGYTFSGWSEIPATMPANDVTITGSFTLDALEPTEEGEVAVSDPEGALDIRLQGNREDIKILKIDGKVTEKDIETILTLDNLLAIYWNANVPLPLSIKVDRSRNLMVYVDDASKVENGAENWVNVIVNGNALNVVLTDGEPLLIPEEFYADNALFIRESTMETVRESSAGWTSLVLPFDVQNIINENRGVIAPFGNDESDVHFWLMECADGFSKATSIVANKPYIIAMPNSPEYFDYYNITGKVAYSSVNVMIHSTNDSHTDDFGDFSIVPAYETVGMSDEVYALNKDTWYIGDKEYKPGSVFMRNSRDVNPFECYLVPKTHDARMRDFVTVGEMNAATDMPEVTMNSNDLRVSVANHSLIITSSRSQIITICNIAGAMVRQMEIPSGSTTISDLPDGVYLVNGIKVALK